MRRIFWLAMAALTSEMFLRISNLDDYVSAKAKCDSMTASIVKKVAGLK